MTMRFGTGQRVHYVLKNGAIRMAQLLKRPDSDEEPHRVTCYVFLDTLTDRPGVAYDGVEQQHGVLMQLGVPYSAEPRPGTWHFDE